MISVIQTTTIDIKNQTIQIPILKTFDSDLACDLTETWMIEVLEPLLNQHPGIFLDVGVNLGQTLIKVKGLEPGRKYIGFEPNSTCVVYAKALIKANQFRDCTIVPAGLFTEDAILALECMDESEADSAASLIQGFRPDHVIQHRMFVPVYQFQTIAKSLGIEDVAIVKIDVEGAELEVLQSLSSLLRDCRPLLLLEILPVYSSENMMRQQRQDDLERLLRTVHYSMFRVLKTDDNQFAGLQSIASIDMHGDLTQCDYLVVPDESRDVIQDLFQT